MPRRTRTKPARTAKVGLTLRLRPDEDLDQRHFEYRYHLNAGLGLPLDRDLRIETVEVAEQENGESVVLVRVEGSWKLLRLERFEQRSWMPVGADGGPCARPGMPSVSATGREASPPDQDDIAERLAVRARIRREIPGRRSVQEGKADRLADLLDEAAGEIRRLRAA